MALLKIGRPASQFTKLLNVRRIKVLNLTSSLKYPFLIIACILLAQGLQAQETAYYSLQAQYTFTGPTYRPAVGLGIEGMFGKRLSINFSVMYGPVDSDQYYFYTGGGQALGVYLIKKGFENTSDLALGLPLGILSFVIPESLAYRIPMSETSQLAIYLAPFGYEVLRNTALESSVERTTYELGLRYYLKANHWIQIVPRVGMKGFYDDRDLGLTYGLSVLLKGKKKSD